jgi:hypothetical protein
VAEQPSEADALHPQLERDEPTVRNPGLTDLSRRDWAAVFVRAANATECVNAELRRSRELQEGGDASQMIDAPRRSAYAA